VEIPGRAVTPAHPCHCNRASCVGDPLAIDAPSASSDASLRRNYPAPDLGTAISSECGRARLRRQSDFAVRRQHDAKENRR
jgi:hypothetical protein